MEAVSLPTLLLAIAGFLSPVITLILGLAQARQKKDRDDASSSKDFAESAKLIGESWEQVANDLRDEISRIKKSTEEREGGYLSDIQAFHVKLDQAEKRANRFEIRLNTIEPEWIKLNDENKALRKLVNELTDKLSIAQEQIEVLKQARKEDEKIINLLRLELKQVKKTTGELKMRNNDE